MSPLVTFAILAFSGLLTIALIIAVALTLFYKKKFVLLEKKLVSSLRKNTEISSFVNFFSEKLCSYSTSENVYTSIAEKIAALVDAESVCIYNLHENKYFIPVGYTEAFPPLNISKDFILSKPRFLTDALKQEKIELGEGIIGEVGLSKKAVLLGDNASTLLYSEKSLTAITSLMAVPMLINEQIVGVICAINSKTTSIFTEPQFAMFDAVSKLVSVIHQIIQTFSVAAKQDRINQEIEFTRLLQASLIPKESPSWKPFEIHAFTRSAKEVNGDFYDFVKIDENRLLVVLGDASGKGIPACMMMTMARSFIRANSERFTSLSNLMSELNSNLYRDTNEGRYATIACCLLDRQEESVEFARAGHTELMVHSSKQKVRKLRPHGTALGLLPNELTGSFDSISFCFKPYYTMLMFSDGIIESLNNRGDEFGIDNLQKIFYESCCKKNSPSKSTDRILRAIDEFLENKEQSDDQTIVIIGHEKFFI
jgi:sigma-B regulation protein RsbU (phosphoserine phosphatase)